MEEKSFKITITESGEKTIFSYEIENLTKLEIVGMLELARESIMEQMSGDTVNPTKNKQ